MSIRFCLALLLPALFSMPLTAGENPWASFRGPAGQGVDPSAKPPLQWSQTNNIAWKIAIPGPGASSPIVWGDRVYLTCYSGFFVPGKSGSSQENLKRHLLAYNLKDGSTLWDAAVTAKLPEEDKIRDHGFAASTPAADFDRIYTFQGKTGVIAFSHTGKQLWQTLVGSRTHGWGSATSPVLHKELVIINASVESESLVALDRSTGKEKWRVQGIQESWNTPILVTAKTGRKELIVAVQGKVLAFDPDTGKELWSCKTDITWYMVPGIVEEDGLICCLGGRSGVAALAIRTGGSGDVTSTHRLWTSNKGSNVASPVLHKGHLYWTHEQQGIAYCAKADTGAIVYEERLPRAGQFYASALLADGRLHYLTREGKTFVIAAQPNFRQLAVNDLSDRSIFNASPVPAKDKLLIRSDKFLYCLQAK